MNEREMEKQTQLMQDARLISLNDGVIYPMLLRQKDAAISRMIWKFDEGKDLNFIAEVAQLSLIDKQLRELQRKQTLGNNAFEKLNQDKVDKDEENL